jgi:hypothetical protein
LPGDAAPLDTGSADRYHTPVMAEPRPEPVEPAPGEPAREEPARGEVEALFALVRQRYGERLTAEELAAVREGIEGIVRTTRALRAVRLRNSDEPLPPFAPFRAEP